MTSEAFRLAYAGPAVEDHEMGVAELAASLLAMSDALKRAAVVADPEGHIPTLNIKATEPGSFQVLLEVLTDDSLVGSAMKLLTGKHVTATLNAAGLLGIVVSAIGGIKWLRGRPPAIEDSQSEGMVYLKRDGDTLEVSVTAAELIADPDFRKSVAEAISPLDSPGFTTVSLDRDQGESVKVARDERPYFTSLPEREDLEVGERQARLRPVGVDFGWRQWRVKDLDAGVSFRVSVDDEAFRAQVRRGEISVGANDTLHVTLRSAEYVTNTGEIGQRHTVVSVDRYEAGHTEGPLF